MGPDRTKQSTPRTCFHELDWTRPDRIADQDLVRFVNDEYTRGLERRRTWEIKAAEQLAYIRGDQHLTIHRNELTGEDEIAESRVEDLPLRLRRPMQVNLMRRFVTSWLGMVVSDKMSFACLPQTDDDVDTAAARIQGKTLRYHWHEGRRPGIVALYNALWFVFGTGVGYLKTTWDEWGGPAERLNPEALLGGKGIGPEARDRVGLIAAVRERMAKIMKRKPSDVPLDDEGRMSLPSGDLVFEEASGFDVTMDPAALSLAEAEWVIHSRARTHAYGRARYGQEKWDQVRPNDLGRESWRRFQGLFTYDDDNDTTGNAMDDGEEMPIVHELQVPVLPGIAPRGALILVAGEVLLKKGFLPHPHGEVSLVEIRETIDPVNSRPGCTCRDLMHGQRALNQLVSEQHAHHEIAIQPRAFAEEDAGLPEKAFETRPSVITVKAGSVAEKKIQMVTMPPLPAESHMLKAAILSDMQDIAGIHNTTWGDRETNVKSGRHAAIVKEGDRRNLDLTGQLVRTALQRVAGQALWLLYKHVDKERVSVITGDNGRREVLRWRGKDLSPTRDPFAPYGWNVRVDLAVAPEPTIALEQIEALTNLGYLNPADPEDRDKVMRWMGENLSGTVADEAAADRTNARIENDKLLAADEPMPVWPGDNDLVHIREHERFGKSDEFREAAQTKPALLLLLELHVREHHFRGAQKMVRPRLIAEQVELQMRQQMGLMPAAQPAGAPGQLASSAA